MIRTNCDNVYPPPRASDGEEEEEEACVTREEFIPATGTCWATTGHTLLEGRAGQATRHLSWTVVHSVEEITILIGDPTVRLHWRPGECPYLNVIFTIFREGYK